MRRRTANDAVLTEGEHVLIDDTGRFDDAAEDERPLFVLGNTVVRYIDSWRIN
ncbi:hypothetical protein [Streptomyces sp. NPDC055036]